MQSPLPIRNISSSSVKPTSGMKPAEDPDEEKSPNQPLIELPLTVKEQWKVIRGKFYHRAYTPFFVSVRSCLLAVVLICGLLSGHLLYQISIHNSPNSDPNTQGIKSMFREELTCDRQWRTDVCDVSGDVRLDARRNLIMLYARRPETKRGIEGVKPYTRKWESSIMDGIQEIFIKSVDAPEDLEPWQPTPRQWNMTDSNGKEIKWAYTIPERNWEPVVGNSSEWSEEEWRRRRASRLPKNITQFELLEIEREKVGVALIERGGVLEKIGSRGWVKFKRPLPFLTNETVQEVFPSLKCDIKHRVPGVIFTTSGYTGNLYHEFNDGLIPLFITADIFKGKFVTIIESSHVWWFYFYEKVLRQLSSYPVVLLGDENYIHCFPRIVVGLRFHDELAVNASLMSSPSSSIHKFQRKLGRAWTDPELVTWVEPELKLKVLRCKPTLSIISRQDSRVMENEAEVIAMAESIGFFVKVVRPDRDLPLPWVWNHLQSANVMVGVHGAAMTQMLFMRPGSYFIQIIPLGTEWAAKTYYGDPAVKLGLNYIEYKIGTEESSLRRQYAQDDPVLVDPESIRNSGGWWKLKDVYLKNQNLTLDLDRLGAILRDVKSKVVTDPLYVHDQLQLSQERCQ